MERLTSKKQKDTNTSTAYTRDNTHFLTKKTANHNKPFFARLQKIYFEWGYIYRLPLVYSLLLAALLGSIFTQQYYQTLQRDIQDQHEELAVYKSLIETHLRRYDFKTIGSMAELLLHREYIKKISVKDNNGYQIVSLSVDNYSSGNFKLYDYTLHESIEDSANIIGYMAVEVRSEPQSKLVARLLLVLFSVFTGVFIVSALLLARHASTHVVRPLKVLSDAIDQTLRSGMPVKTGLDDSTHIGRFAAEFNNMQEKLTNVQLEVVNQVRALEQQTIINQQHVSILDAVMHNFKNTIRYFDQSGKVTDYGESTIQIDRLLIPNVFFPNAADAITHLNHHHGNRVIELRDVGSSGMSISKGLYQIECQSNSNKIYLLTAFSLPDYGFAYTLTDVTKSKNIERELAHAQKMEALGVLTSGISHDFNNMLGVVTGNIELAMIAAKDREAVLIPLSTALKAGMTGASVVQSMLAYSRSREYEVEAINISSHVRDLLPLLIGSLPPEIDLISSLKCDGWCHVNTGLFESAILNLIANARDAIEGKGEIEIVVQTATPEMLSGAGITPSQYVAITVSDTGSGVPPEVMQRIYDPFFTTKIQGTGLGLSLIFGFAEQIGGKLHHENNTPHGASFTIFLPIVPAKANPAPKLEPHHHSICGNGHILLIDDVPELLGVIKSALSLSGYQVVSCPSYKEAKQLLINDSTACNFDLVISDVKLKDGDGVNLLQYKRTELPIILISGNSMEDLPDDRNIVAILTKPFTIKSLITTVNQQVREITVN